MKLGMYMDLACEVKVTSYASGCGVCGKVSTSYVDVNGVYMGAELCVIRYGGQGVEYLATVL